MLRNQPLSSKLFFGVFCAMIWRASFAADSAPASQELIDRNMPLGSMEPVNWDPATIAMSAIKPDKDLAAWYEEWRLRRLKKIEISSEQIRRLQLSLSASSLSAVEMLTFAHAFHFVSEDIELSAMIYDAASIRIEAEFKLPKSATEIREIETSIFYHMQDFKHVLWPLIESHRTRYATTLYRIYSGFVSHIPADDSQLVKASRRPAVGMAECLYVLQRPEEALQLLESVRFSQSSPSDKTAWSWIYSLVLVALGREREAMPYLDDVVKNPGFEYAAAALALRNQLQSAGSTTKAAKSDRDAALP